MTAALQRTAALLEQASLAYHIPEDIHKALWYKLMINIGMNQVSAVTGAPYGLFQKDKELRSLMNAAMRETIVVARAEGVDLTEKDLETWYTVLDSLGPEGKTSMLQDIEAQRKTEVDSFAGEIIRRAARHGLSVPVNETLKAIICTKEKLSE
jgi:2-dehydropantoate 2-reductase